MPLPDTAVTVTPPSHLFEDAKGFFRFLRVAAQKHSVIIKIIVDKNGSFSASIPSGGSEGLDGFLQEIIFHNGLYYYLCGVSRRRDVARLVAKPFFEGLLAARYDVVFPVQIQKHLLEGNSDWGAGEFLDGTAQKYEILFQKRKLRMITPYEFVRDADDLLTEFMLVQLGHPKGQKSPKFNILVEKCGQQDVLRSKEFRQLFNKVHSLRTRGLHRLEREIPENEISDVAQEVYEVFRWLDDYWRAQDKRTVMLSGKRYRRIRYGKEPFLRNEPDDSRIEFAARPCHDCGAIRGELHLEDCDIEVCPRCGGQFFCCHCRLGADDRQPN